MKYFLLKTLSVTLIALAFCTQALAFISVIDVTNELLGEKTTIQSSNDHSLNDMNGNKLSYRGEATEIISLFSEIAESTQGFAEVDFELNEKTQTISFTVKSQGFGGFTYSYWILTKSGN